MDVNRFIELLNAYLQNNADEDNQQELFLMIASGKYDEEIRQRVDASFEDSFAEMDPAKAKEILEHIIAKPGSNGKIIPLKRRTGWIKWVAAACIVLTVGVAVFSLLTKHPYSPPIAQQTHDVPAPSNSRAVITLANGSKVYLDSASNGTIAQQNNVSVVKNEMGEIVYNSTSQPLNNSTQYNTLSNPRGSKVISLTLSDGTRVWLNSESSLRYPTAFTATTREVEITGEAYFEVKHNAKQPFKVHLPNGSVVEDIGTSFNINAYNDEADIKTTLVEGAVKVMSPAGGGGLNDSPNRKRPGVVNDVILKPGQQAVLNQVNPKITRIEVQTVDLEKITSWKNNEFNFQDDDIQTIMRQLARWYNIQPIITAPSQSNYTGRITRDVPLSEVLKMFERVGYVKFEIKDRVVRVIPVNK